ncbi:hypothetical protein C7H19_07555 [Aphanothece hegewaldii CCALA 016]|uniref:histidine kinase n=1 Tax=Aphanothece hegewaldii CCALA 016 TaxID=2107694 RepID=A0A2T1LZJ3_9CHRO|nr:ATP-binding protein [Aphanothece hegewaldii]PSF37831.1 hypothetical protein C7H19_07555 [Aphanothece hegewaldii CCALA 016]
MAWISNAALLTVIAFSGGWWWWYHKKTTRLQTQLREKTQQLQKSYAELDQAVASHQDAQKQDQMALEWANWTQKNLSAKISSEFKNPLHTILGYAVLLQRYPHLAQEEPENLEQIRQNGEHLLALINDVLEIIQLESNQLELHEANFNIRRFLDSLEETIQPKAIAKGLNLVFFIPPDIPTKITTDEQKLRQVLLNILDNAIKYTQTGSVTLRVGISDRTWMLEENDDHPSHLATHSLFFEIEDTGVGIPSEQLKCIFEPLSANEPKMRSMGLGLVSSQKLVKLLGGKITITSKVAQGTIVKVKLTVKGWEIAQWDSFFQGTGQIIGLAPYEPEYRILVVDDRRENRYLLIKFLEPLGFKLEEAANGEEAIHFWSTWQPHLIFMDTRMPVMDGYQAIAEIQRLQVSSEEPFKTVIIGLSSGTVEDYSDISAIGCDDILQKPFEIETILEKIAQHLNVRYVYEIEEKEDFDDDDLSTIPLSEFPTSTSINNSMVTPYKDMRRTKNSSSDLRSEYPIPSNNLEVMSRDWIERLYSCAVARDSEGICQLLEQIPSEHEALVSSLQSLVEQNNFRNLKELAQFLLSRP